MKSRRYSKPSRRGFTLRELMIAITVGSTVMMTAVSLVHHAFDWSTQAKHRRMDDQTYFNLSRQFRDDIHVADTAKVDDSDSPGDSLKLSIADGNSVVYTVDDNLITRVETDGDDTVRRETYRFKHRRKIAFLHAESDNHIQLTITTITPFEGSEAPLWRSLRASIGLRLRHQNGDIES